MLEPIPQKEVNDCLDQFRSLGFSRLLKPEQNNFEAHLLENAQFLVIKGRLVASLTDLRFFDDPAGPKKFGPSATIGERRFVWNHAFLTIEPQMQLSQKLLEALKLANVIKGFPLGIVTDEPSRISEIRSLGASTEQPFCSEIIVGGLGMIRLYSSIAKLPTFEMPARPVLN